MAQFLRVSVEPASVEVQAGQESVARLTVRNRGEAVGQYALRMEGIDPAWATIEPDQLGVFPGEEATARVRLRPPQNAIPATYPAIVRVFSLGDEPGEARAIFDLIVRAGLAAPAPPSPSPAPTLGTPTPTVPPAPPLGTPTPAAPPAPTPSMPIQAISPGPAQLELAADRRNVTVSPGSQERINLAVRNRGGAPLSVELTAQGPPAQWVALNPASIALLPNQSAPAGVTLSPAADAPLGSYPLTVRAQSRNDPSIAVRLDLVLEIGQPAGLAVELVPTQAEGQTKAEYTVQVAYSGPTPLRASLSADDDEGACDYTFDPVTVLLVPGSAATSHLTVRARQRVTNGARTYSFRVFATAAEGPALAGQAQGRFVQRRAPPPALDLSPTRQAGADRVIYSVRVANPGDAEETFRFSASDPVSACQYEFVPPVLTVPPGGLAQATLTVTPRVYHSEPREKIHTFTIRAEPAGEVLAPAQVDGQFIQTALEPPGLALTPSSQPGWRAVTFNLQVTNPRGAPLDVEFQPQDPSGSCVFTVTPPRLRLPPHAEVNARLTVRPIIPLLPGEVRRTCRFSVAARIENLDRPALVEGSLIQVPQPWWMKPFVWVAAIAGLLALTVGSFIILSLIQGMGTVKPAASPVPTIAARATVPQVLPPTLQPPTRVPPTPSRPPDERGVRAVVDDWHQIKMRALRNRQTDELPKVLAGSALTFETNSIQGLIKDDAYWEFILHRVDYESIEFSPDGTQAKVIVTKEETGKYYVGGNLDTDKSYEHDVYRTLYDVRLIDGKWKIVSRELIRNP